MKHCPHLQVGFCAECMATALYVARVNGYQQGRFDLVGIFKDAFREYFRPITRLFRRPR